MLCHISKFVDMTRSLLGERKESFMRCERSFIPLTLIQLKPSSHHDLRLAQQRYSQIQDIMSKTNQTQASLVSLHQRAVLGACFAPKKKIRPDQLFIPFILQCKSKNGGGLARLESCPKKSPNTSTRQLFAGGTCFLSPKLQAFFSARPDFCSSLTTTLQILQCSNYR